MDVLGASLVIILLAAVAVAWLVLIIAALNSIFRHRRLSGTAKAVWTLLVFAFPILGPCAWFIWGREGS
ncbi:MAG: PLDc N-terminal domain-containing protein [Mycobacteriaceae bacterium]|uniref:PLDc N-terminal domain-containing protein n=1 Tax=Corynebacterium sp. TaxID=1720 RepID=UPI003F9817A5